VNNRIPANVKEISAARAHGDLRENFEYHAAKQMQVVLNTRKGELERDLERARPSDFSGADTSAINIGTRIVLEIPEKGDAEYTLLGAWDADPENNVLSYLSVMGQALLGKAEGDAATVTDPDTEKQIEVTVKSISAL
jgi:transcription elongation GreA/GreB family factor